MLTFLITVAVRLIDPLAIVMCAGLAPFIGSYRIAVPVGAAVYLALMLGLSNPSLYGALSALFAGAVLAAIGLFLWRLVPSSFKRAMTKD